MTFVLGLTGSIGMGKSTTAKFFREAGVPVHDSDAVVHRLYEGEAVAPVEAAFPGTVVDGKVDRAKLSERLVGNQDAIRRLEAIVHPLVRAVSHGFMEQQAARGTRIVVLDIPLLFETGGEKRVDAVVVVSTSPELQRERVLARGTMDEAKLDAIIAKQTPDAEKRKRADFVVDTSHGLEPVRAQIAHILAEVVKMPQRRA
jgi:dephospho-CoA kinase